MQAGPDQAAFAGPEQLGGVTTPRSAAGAGEFEKACGDYEFFGLGGVAKQLREAVRLAVETAPMDALEAQLDRVYWKAVPDDAALGAVFETHFERHPHAYAPLMP